MNSYAMYEIKIQAKPFGKLSGSVKNLIKYVIYDIVNHNYRRLFPVTIDSIYQDDKSVVYTMEGTKTTIRQIYKIINRIHPASCTKLKNVEIE